MQYVKLFNFDKMTRSFDSIESEINKYIDSTTDLVANIAFSEDATNIKIMLLMQKRQICVFD